MADKPKIISTVKARGGITPHIVRYVLMISLVLAVAAMAFVYMGAPTATQDGPTSVPGPQ